ncbi:MAG: GDP-mannose 4,6-dehydratase [Chloroflexi bacterium]|nr:GDP-mannose 4,6-dehydratase [Chloroflexota bacterium]
MRALITGGAGFIGSHLAEKLLGRGDEVMIIDDLSTGSFDNIKHLTGDLHFHFAIETILNEAVMDRLVSECDCIYHLAAAVGVELVIRDPVHTIEANVLGTDVVLKTANRYRKKVILTSTSEIYGKGVNPCFGENDDRLLGPVTRSRWSYACSKTLDEFLALAYFRQKKLPVVICRLFNTIGPRQTGHYGMVAPRFVRQALAGEPVTVYGDGQQSRCFCNVLDVVEALSLLCGSDQCEGEVFNVGNDHDITISDLARKVIAMTGSRSKIVYIPYEQAYEEGFEDMQRRKPDTAKIRRMLGWRPEYSLDETLQSMIDYEKRLMARG